MQKQGLIYKCAAGHISFAKHLQFCGMKGCGQPIEPVSERDIEWFYRVNPDGLAMNEKDLNMMMEDKNMPKEVKKAIEEIFPERKVRKKRFWFA